MKNSNGTKNEEVDKLSHGVIRGSSRSMFTKSSKPRLKLLIRQLDKDRIRTESELFGIGTPTSCRFAANEFVVDRLKSGTREYCFDDCLRLQIGGEDSTAPREERCVWICSDPIYRRCTQANSATPA